MAVVAKRLGKGIFPNTLQNLYTVPSNTTTLVKAITICNVNSSPISVVLQFAAIAIIGSHVIKPNDTITIPFLDQVLQSGESITGSCSSGALTTYYISGKEVT